MGTPVGKLASGIHLPKEGKGYLRDTAYCKNDPTLHQSHESMAEVIKASVAMSNMVRTLVNWLHKLLRILRS